jgi:predicted DNA-binding transcriptional regulator YafY
MYLPFLTLAGATYSSTAKGDTPADARRLRPGYRNIPSLQFEPEELGALVSGAQLAMSLEDPAIAADALSAIRKLACDFPIDVALGREPDVIIPQRENAVAARLRALGQALLRLKRVTFTYRGMARDNALPRSVEPYGLFFLRGHWYLAGLDVEVSELRNFRVSRMRDVTVNEKRPQSSDYSIPVTFRLADHAVDRSAWELGHGDSVEMVVEFRGSSGAATAALRLGAASTLGPRFRVFRVRRVDVFARWILSFAGEAIPISPPILLDACRKTAGATLAMYRNSA